LTREDHRRHDELLQQMRTAQKAKASEGFELKRSDLVAICVGVIVAIVLYLEPQKTPAVTVVCLLVLSACLGFLLFHWCSRWPWVKKATPTGRKARLIVIGLIASTVVAAYGRHAWPSNDSIEHKLDDLTELLKAQGYEVNRQKLLAKYPLGYVIFDLDYRNSVFPYEGQALLDKWEFDWSVVRYTENSPNRIMVQLPDIRLRGGPTIVKGIITGGPKRVGNLGGGGVFFSDGGIDELAEILAIRDTGIVFLIGFDRAAKLPSPK
jgi:hypothetical protein